MTDDPHVRLLAAIERASVKDMVRNLTAMPRGFNANTLAILRRAVPAEHINLEGLRDGTE